MKTILKIAAIAFLAMVGTAPVIYSQVSGDVHIRVAPPRPHHEVRTVRPDAGSVWIGGYHEYDPATSSYHWHEGRWDHPPREGAVWVAPRYKHHHDEYIYTPGRWK